jgi:peptidoglycan hydrolase-like amidase
VVLSVRRERDRDGKVSIRLVYPDQEELVPCDRIMTALEIPSCPDSIVPTADGAYVFQGQGKGHGEGLDLGRAAYLARSGSSAEDILTDAFERAPNS